MQVWRIKDWPKHFENNRSRDIKLLDWVPIPNNMDGSGYTWLVEFPDPDRTQRLPEDKYKAAAHFGAWVALVEIASKCSPRGTLARESGAPHDIRSLARMTRFHPDVIAEAIPRLLELGWLETITLENKQVTTEPTEINEESAAIPHPSATKPQYAAPRVRAERNEENEGNGIERTNIVVALGKEGIENGDPVFADPHCTPEQVAIAIDNANAEPVGKIKDRKAFIVTAIRNGYALSKKAAAKRQNAKRLAALAATESVDKKALADTLALDVIAPREIYALPEQRRKELAEIVFQKHESWRLIPGMDKKLPMLKAMYKIHKETSCES